MPKTADLYKLTATAAVKLLKAGKVSPRELLDAAEARIKAVDGAVNALPTLCFDRARKRSKKVKKTSLLAGLPIAIKDLTEVAGVRTTFGSPIYADYVPAKSSLIVERLEANGALVVAKANTPEFGAGANTFNPVLGTTRNPWDTRLSAAGSSGGSAVALATGQIWLAEGSDLGGSLRTPAAFNSVVGLRPTPGRVARAPTNLPYDILGVNGPMARTVADVALMLDAMAGEHPADPISLPAPAQPFSAAVKRPKPPKRVAFSADLGICTVDPEIATVCRKAAADLAALGVEVEEASPDFAGAYEAFQALRAMRFVSAREPLLKTHRHMLKDDVIWNIEEGLRLSPSDIGRAERERAALFKRVAAFFETYDLLIAPAMQAKPYPVEKIYVDEIAGKKMKSYIDWITITFAISVTACPALALPAGFSKEGLPVGLQIVGPPRSEARILAAGALLEEILGLAEKVPIDPRVRHAFPLGGRGKG
jgi:amidase